MKKYGYGINTVTKSEDVERQVNYYGSTEAATVIDALIQATAIVREDEVIRSLNVYELTGNQTVPCGGY